MEITYKILEWKDEETGKPLVDVILDSAQQKELENGAYKMRLT